MTPDYFQMAWEGTLPPGFKDWELEDEFGVTLAVIAAFFNKLPPDFDRWEITDGLGRTVGHMAALFGSLTGGFDRWALATPGGMPVKDMFGCWPGDPAPYDEDDCEGWTVAHVAARHGGLPPYFDLWGLRT